MPTKASTSAPFRPRPYAHILCLLPLQANHAIMHNGISEQELTADLLTVIASFSGRLYGMGSRKQKELVQCVQAVITSP